MSDILKTNTAIIDLEDYNHYKQYEKIVNDEYEFYYEVKDIDGSFFGSSKTNLILYRNGYKPIEEDDVVEVLKEKIEEHKNHILHLENTVNEQSNRITELNTQVKYYEEQDKLRSFWSDIFSWWKK